MSEAMAGYPTRDWPGVRDDTWQDLITCYWYDWRHEAAPGVHNGLGVPVTSQPASVRDKLHDYWGMWIMSRILYLYSFYNWGQMVKRIVFFQRRPYFDPFSSSVCPRSSGGQNIRRNQSAEDRGQATLIITITPPCEHWEGGVRAWGQVYLEDKQKTNSIFCHKKVRGPRGRALSEDRG